MTRKFEPGGPERRGYQKAGLQKMIKTGGVTALLFDPGMGKTATVIDYMSLLALKAEDEVRVLVVCPLVAVDTWVIQMEKFASPQISWWSEALGGSLVERAEALAARGGNLYPKSIKTKKPLALKAGEHPRALHHSKSLAWASSDAGLEPKNGPDGLDKPRLIVEVINIDTLSQRSRINSQTMADVMLDAVKRYNPELIVIDESHKIKSAGGNASRLLARISKFVKRRVMLTGTVMPHSPMDIFGQWRFLDPYAFGRRQADGTFKQATFGSFRDRYAKMGGWMGKEIVGFHRLDEMQDIMSKNSIVARKKDALDLPPTQDVTLAVNLSAREKKAYKEMKEQLATAIASGRMVTTTNRLTQMMRLRQITSGYLPDDKGQVHNIGMSKVKTIASLVNDSLAGENRIVIFALFVKEIEMLVKAIEKPGTEVLTVTGDTPTEVRMAMRKRFGSGDPSRLVMVAQIKTMSLAVNELVTANHAIFASMSQQRDDYIQARDRLDRIGQTRPVTFWHAVALGTVDEVVLKAHRDRGDLESAMLRHIQEGLR